MLKPTEEQEKPNQLKDLKVGLRIRMKEHEAKYWRKNNKTTKAVVTAFELWKGEFSVENHGVLHVKFDNGDSWDCALYGWQQCWDILS